MKTLFWLPQQVAPAFKKMLISPIRPHQLQPRGIFFKFQISLNCYFIFCRKTTTDSKKVYAAVVKGSGLSSNEIGIATIDMNESILRLAQFSDSPTFHSILSRLEILDCSEIIVSNTLLSKEHAFVEALQNSNENPLIPLERRYFNENVGLDYIRDYSLPQCKTLIEVDLEAKFYCLAAAGALLKRIEIDSQITFALESLKVVFEASPQTMVIDSATAKALELVANLGDPKNGLSLFNILNHTFTRAGYKMLRMNILQPPTSLEIIEERLDAIQELLSKPNFYTDVKSQLSHFSLVDIENLTSNIIQIDKTEDLTNAENKIDYMIKLKHILNFVEPLTAVLQYGENEMFKKYFEKLSEIPAREMLFLIEEVIDHVTFEKESINYRTQKCFAVKSGISGLLDISKQIYTTCISELEEQLELLRKQYLPTITLASSNLRGYYLQVSRNDLKSKFRELPDVFQNVTFSGYCVCFTTDEIVDINNRLQMVLQDVFLLAQG